MLSLIPFFIAVKNSESGLAQRYKKIQQLGTDKLLYGLLLCLPCLLACQCGVTKFGDYKQDQLYDDRRRNFGELLDVLAQGIV